MELVIVESRGLVMAFCGISECTFHVRNTLEHYLFEGHPVDRHTGTCTSARDARNSIEQFDPHLIVLGGEPSLTRSGGGVRRLDLPLDLCAYVDVSDQDRARRTLNKRLVRNVRRTVERLSLSVRLSRDDEDFDYFFEAMYVPFMQRRHGIRARTTSKQAAYDALYEWGQGYIVKVFSEDKWVAGMLMPVDEGSRTTYGRCMGFLDVDESSYKAGVSMVMYHYMFEWSLERHMDRLHLGGTYPFVDGVLRAKKKLGCRLYRAREGFRSELGNYEMSLDFRKDHELIRQLLISRPLIVLDESGELAILGFHSHGEAFVPGYSNSNFEKVVTQSVESFMQPLSI